MDIQSVASSAVISQVLGSSVPAGGAAQTAVGSTGSAPTQVQQAAPVGTEQAQKAVDTVNSVVAGLNSNVQFSVDDSTGINLVKVVEKDSDTVIRQLPIQAVIDFAHTLDTIKGLLHKQTV